jgi:hypothetical protein
MARPMPRPPPVTRKTLSANRMPRCCPVIAVETSPPPRDKLAAMARAADDTAIDATIDATIADRPGAARRAAARPALKRARGELQAQLAAAQEVVRRAAAVAKSCEMRPLDQPACLAALDLVRGK